MKSKIPFQAFRKYCLRTPTLSTTFLEDLFTANDIKSEVKKKLKNGVIREAIYLASPDLFKQIKLWEVDNIKDEKKAARIQNAILKYLVRMSCRCTPFGLFAGVAIGEIEHGTKIELSATKKQKRITRYDMHFLVALAKHLEKQDTIKRQLKYYPNSTLYRLGDRYRYVEYSYEDKKRVHSIESVLHSEYLENIIKLTQVGTKLNNLVSYLTNEGFEISESTDFIQELITNQILVSELEPTVTGEDFLEALKKKLTALKDCTEALQLLHTLSNSIEHVTQPLLNDLKGYHSITNNVSTLKIDFEPKFLLQTDIYPKFNYNQLNQRIIRKIKMGLWVLNKISNPQKSTSLEQFKVAFNKRYEHRKMPLLNVLDIESGIGYGNNQVEATPFLDAIRLPQEKVENKFELDPFQELLFQKVQSCLMNNESIVELSLEELEAFEENWENAPDTLSVMAEIIVKEGKSKIVMDNAGSHANRILGRFATNDNDVGNLVKEIAKKEKEINADKILAEIVHVPESRTGNILRRPHIRQNEIPCLGFSGLPQNQQINLTDILVSVDNNKINLTQASSGKKILPRLSNAHNYSNNPLPVYQFLCDLQHQSQRSYSFNWGDFSEKMFFLPRVVIKDVVLSKSRWKLFGKNLEDFKSLWKENTNADVIHQEVNKWVFRLKLKNRVQLVEGDNTLHIDFTSFWSVNMLYKKIKMLESVILQEVLEDENPLVKRDVSTFKNEFVFSFYNNKKALLN